MNNKSLQIERPYLISFSSEPKCCVGSIILACSMPKPSAIVSPSIQIEVSSCGDNSVENEEKRIPSANTLYDPNSLVCVISNFSFV